MKHFCTILFLLLCTVTVNAQTVFAPPGSVWHFENIPDLEAPGQNYIRYQTEKDTLVYGRLCSKITGKRIQINKDQNGYDTLEQETQFTYTSGDTVFYYNHVFSRFLVLYNFDVKVGDTVTYHVPYKYGSLPDTTFQIEIKEVNIVVVDGISQKVILAKPLPSSLFSIRSMMERAGSFSAVSFIGHRLQIDLPRSGGLRCYKDTDIDTNSGIWKYGCEELEALSLHEKELAQTLKLYPNPASDFVSLEYPAGQVLQFAVMDMMGRELPVAHQAASGSVSFDIRHLSAGLYFIKVSDPATGNKKTMKFLKSGS